MKRALMLAMVIVIILIPLMAIADCTLGVKDCRHQINPLTGKPTNQCFWWECQQTGPGTTQYIFTGQPCTCPNRVDLQEILVAQNTNCAYMSKTVSMEQAKKDVSECAVIAELYNRGFSAYVGGDCLIRVHGNPKGVFEFQKCMSEKGYPDFGFKKGDY